MAVNATHPDYDAAATEWSRARDVLAGEDAVKAGGEKYLPRLDSQTDEEFSAYVKRASYFNASARTSEAYLGLMFRRPPFVKLPDGGAGVGRAMAEFQNDADMLGTTLTGYAKMVVGDVVGLGRAGSLVDWEDEVEQRAYVVFFRAEQVINWRVERVNGRNVPTLIVLAEHVIAQPGPDDDGFSLQLVDQMRVLKLVPGEDANAAGKRDYHYQVELWQPKKTQRRGAKVEWQLVETRMPLRLGKPLPLIPFVFHGPRHSRPDVDRGPLEDIVAVNLDHYRLNADFKHGLHFTALPTAWVSGFDKGASLRIGSSTAWVSETPGATAGFLEFTGQGLTTHERAMDRDERLMAILGSRMLEDMKKVGETATAIELRQAGEYSILSNVALSLSESMTQVLRWVYWWNSTEELPDDVKGEQVLMQLNTDFSTIIEMAPEFDTLAQGGGREVKMPFWKDLTATRQLLNDSASLTVNKIAADTDIARIHNDAQVWSVNHLAKVVSGDDPMQAIVDLVAAYWARTDEALVISCLKGMFAAASMSGNLLAIHSESIAGQTSNTRLNGATFVDACAKLGDAASRLTAVAMHSATEAALKKLDLIDFLPDSEGKPSLASFQGRRVVVDDSLPTRAGTTDGTVYTTYLFGQGAFAKGVAPLSGTPLQGGFGTEGVELARVPLDSDTVLINRRRYILHPRGVKFTSASVAGDSPTSAELETSSNWVRIWENKNVRLVAVTHNN